MNHQRTTTNLTRLAGVALAATIALTACGDDGDDAIRDGVLTVEMSDFTYDGIPDEVPAGTRIEVTNSSTVELHEFVAFRLPEGDDRPVEDVIADAGALLASGPPAAVLLAPPDSEEQIAAVGDGTLAEPGRYVILCAIPTGADPGEYLAAAAESDGPPEVDGGAPHFANGMYAEFEVTT